MRGAAGQPPPSAYKRMGTASGQRPGTGSQGGQNGARTGTAVQVDARPITQHGVSGMKTSAGTGGRKVLDKNFFLSELRQKRSEIATITQNMREELEALEKRQGQYNSMEKRGNDLGREVKLMQEALADYNTVLDKVRLCAWPHGRTVEQPVLQQLFDWYRQPLVSTACCVAGWVPDPHLRNQARAGSTTGAQRAAAATC